MLASKPAETSQPACLRIVTNPIFIKSVLVYAVQIQFYLTN